MAAVDPFGLPPDEAIQWFREKRYHPAFDWRDVWAADHAQAFTVAKATQLDVLADLREAVDRAIQEGRSLQQFEKDLRPGLQAKGWWGEKEIDVLDADGAPTGERRVVQLGSSNRLRTIYETSLRQAQAAGRWERMERTKAARPYGRYVCVMDGRERAEHRAWHNTVLPLDHPWWSTHAPPNGWGCRCKMQSLSDRDLVRYGFQVSAHAPPVTMVPYTNARTGTTIMVPRGIDPSFDYNPGEVARGHQRPYANPQRQTPLANSRSWRDYNRPDARKVQAGRPQAPPLWPREHGPADRERTDKMFRELVGMKDEFDRVAHKDAMGEELVFSQRFLNHLRGDHKREGDKSDPTRTQYAPRVLATIRDPYEIWLVPFRDEITGRVVMRKRYVGVFSDSQELLVASMEPDGYVAWTTMSKDNINSQRKGYLLYPRDGAQKQ